MEINELVEQVLAEVDGETAEKINGTLGKIKTAVLSLIDDAKNASSESKGRKLEIRQLKKDLEDTSLERDELKTAAAADNSKEELDSLRDFKTKSMASRKAGFLKSFEIIKAHSNFEKAKGLFDVPEKIEEMTDAQLEKNIVELDKLNNLAYFGDIKKVDTDDKPVDGKNQSLLDKISAAKTMAEIEAIQAEENL